jgi:hypothetical protein
MISEIDLNDWEDGDVTPLYNLDSNSYFKMPVTGTLFYFDHLDGMYSVCSTLTGDLVHVAGWTEVIPLIKKVA